MKPRGDDGVTFPDSTVEYLRLVFFHPLSVLGLVLAAVGLLVGYLSAPSVGVLPPSGALGGGLLLLGALSLAFGFTRAQQRMREE